MMVIFQSTGVQLAVVAAQLWGHVESGQISEAQALFRDYCLPLGPVVERVVDLGAGDGRFSLVLARRYPGAAILAIDREDMPLLVARAGAPANIVNMGGFHFEDVIPCLMDGGPLLVDGVYVMFPNVAAAGFFMEMGVALVGAGKGVIHLLSEAAHTAEQAQDILKGEGFVTDLVRIPFEVIPSTGYSRVVNDHPDLYWLRANRPG